MQRQKSEVAKMSKLGGSAEVKESPLPPYIAKPKLENEIALLKVQNFPLFADPFPSLTFR